MEFEQNFYVIYYEKSTVVGAFEMFIGKGTGCIFPEYGPNMMWNTKYGHGGMMGRLEAIPTRTDAYQPERGRINSAEVPRKDLPWDRCH